MRRIWKKQWKKAVNIILSVALLIGCMMGETVQAQQVDIIIDERIEQAVQDPKTQHFLDENKELITQLTRQYEDIQVVIGTGANTSKDETYEQLIQYFSCITQIPYTIQKVPLNLDEIPSMLEEEVDLILGIVLPEQKEQIPITDSKIDKLLSYQSMEGELFHNSLLLVSHTKNGEVTRKQIPNYYWGSVMAYEELINETVLKGHTVFYNTYVEMIEACESGNICGMILPESYYEFEQTKGDKRFEKVEGISFGATEYYAALPTSMELTQIFDQVLSLYEELYESYFDLTLMKQRQEQIRDSVIIAGSTSLIGLCLIKGILHSIEEWKLTQMKKKLKIQSERTSDVLYIDMKRKRVCSAKGFHLFGLTGHRKKASKKKMSMKHLTQRIGFDFFKYYDYIVKKQQLRFQNSFTLYIQGVPYEFEEEGRVEGKRIVTIMYRK